MSHAVTMDSVAVHPRWKTAVNWVASILVAILFLASGIWKISDPFGWAVLLHQLKFPQMLSLPGAVIVGTLETFTGLLFLAPGYRRIAAWIGSGLLLIFMFYIGINYTALHGVDCSCFPFVKRAVNPAFFAEDAGMLALAILSGRLAGAQAKLRGAAIVFGAVAICAVVFLGVASARQTGTKAPPTILVNGKPYAISDGKVFIYFYDPECMHCLDAGERMSHLNWGSTRFVGQPVVRPQFAQAFMDRTGLKGVTAGDFALLKKTFPYAGTPAGVALENGRQVAAIAQFDEPEPAATLKKLDFAH